MLALKLKLSYTKLCNHSKHENQQANLIKNHVISQLSC